jgi:hypothetical protein
MPARARSWSGGAPSRASWPGLNQSQEGQATESSAWATRSGSGLIAEIQTADIQTAGIQAAGIPTVNIQAVNIQAASISRMNLE